jgi:hypothetical protein
MAQSVSILLSAEDRERLSAIIVDRKSPLKHIQRANIVLLSAEKLSVLEVSRRSGISRPNVWRWQQRFAEEGVGGLLRDKTRKPGRTPLAPETVARILALPCSEPPGEVTHWTGRAVAKVRIPIVPATYSDHYPATVTDCKSGLLTAVSRQV